VTYQDGFGHHGTEPARSTKSDNDDDRMQKKSENVAHAEDGIRLRKLKNSGRLLNSPPTGSKSRTKIKTSRSLTTKSLTTSGQASAQTPGQLGRISE
jgi:hypothetical protein